MTNPNATVTARLPWLSSAIAYLCFARVWWDGDGFDSASWWKSDAEVRHQIARTGETFVRKEAVIIKDEWLDETKFSSVITEFLELRFLHIDSQCDRRRLSHFDDWFGIKVDSDSAAHWFFVAGGLHDDPQADVILARFEKICPEIFQI